MPKNKIIQKNNNKTQNSFYVRTRPNLGIYAQIQKVEHFNTLPIIRTFTEYKYAEEYVKKEGNIENVYFISSDKWDYDDKWVYGKNKEWKKTFYRQGKKRDGKAYEEPPFKCCC